MAPRDFGIHRWKSGLRFDWNFGWIDMDITRYFRHIEKVNKSRETVEEPAMKAVFLYVKRTWEDQLWRLYFSTSISAMKTKNCSKLQKRRLHLVMVIKVEQQRRNFNRNLALIPCEHSWNFILVLMEEFSMDIYGVYRKKIKKFYPRICWI